ncbi:DUF3261 domain-containing protein [Cobetia crustatorum]|uniref:DUF3261 domain-containing protein n=1 Tax=Cobetia crustatorum TaxID=553385 RepID=UPI0004691816|nr:DUF3261 domain-containing protein [Cobetia crustatorum]
MNSLPVSADTVSTRPSDAACNLRTRCRPLLAAGLGLAASLLLSGCSLFAPQPLSAQSPMPALSSLQDTTTQRLSLRMERMDENGKAVMDDASPRLPPLLGVLRQSPEAMRLVLLSVQGQRLLTLVHDNDGSRFENARPDVLEKLPFTADWLARRISWVHWPQAAIDKAFMGTDWQLVQAGDWQHPNQPAQRIIRQGNDVIAELDRDAQGRVSLSDPASGRVLVLTPLPSVSFNTDSLDTDSLDTDSLNTDSLNTVSLNTVSPELASLEPSTHD